MVEIRHIQIIIVLRKIIALAEVTMITPVFVLNYMQRFRLKCVQNGTLIRKHILFASESSKMVATNRSEIIHFLLLG